MTFNRSILVVASLSFAMAGASGAARAADCTKPSDCAKGFTCVILPIAVPVAEPACAKDVDGGCTFIDPTTPAPVTTPTAGQCELAPCATENDCGTGMVCYTTTSSECTGGTTTGGPACPPNADCKPIPTTPPVCTETKTSMCAYKWQVPCNKDNDCGAGFTCTPTVSGECSGSAGGGTASSGGSVAIDAGAAPAGATAPASPPEPVTPVTPPTCTTTTSFPGYCAPKATTCKVDGDCPSLWTCVAEPTAVGVATSGGASTGSGSASSASSAPNEPATGVAPVPTPTPATPSTMVCVAPAYAYTGDRNVGTGSETSTPGGTVPTAAGTGGTGGTSSGQTPPADPTASNGSSSSAPSAGCAVGGSGTGSPFGSLFGVLGLVAVLGLALSRRRR